MVDTSRDAHIVASFDRDLEGVQAQIVKMGGLVEAAIQDATRSLITRDEELAARVQRGDKLVDEMMERVNQDAASIIAKRAPVASDLRLVLTVMRLSASLERVGDYAKNIAKRTKVLVEMRPISGTDLALKHMSQQVEGMLKDMLDAYIQRDADLAEDVRHRDQDVDQMYNALFREFLTYMMEDPGNITACMHLHFIAKNLERMGDLVTNMSEQVIYLVTGAMPDESRPKDDRTPYMTL